MMVAGDADDALLDAIRRAGLDTVAGAFAYNGDGDMTTPWLGHRQRWTLTLTVAGLQRTLFMKRYTREPLKWRIERVLTYGRGGSPASVELDNIRAVLAAAVPTIPAAVAGHETGAGGKSRSYIILAAVPGEALEQSAGLFIERSGLSSGAVAELTRTLADLVGKFHGAGFVHRDLYASHIFLGERDGRIELRLIDMARVFQPKRRAFRWRVKDLAALQYSMPHEWVKRYWDAFMDEYLARLGSSQRGRYERAVGRKAACISRHDAKLRLRRGQTAEAGR